MPQRPLNRFYAEYKGGSDFRWAVFDRINSSAFPIAVVKDSYEADKITKALNRAP